MKRRYCRGKTCLLDWSVVSVVHSKHNKMKSKVKGICLRISEVYSLAGLMQKKTTTFKNLWNCEKRGNQSLQRIKSSILQMILAIQMARPLATRTVWYHNFFDQDQKNCLFSAKWATFLKNPDYVKGSTVWQNLNEIYKVVQKNFQLWFDSNQWDNFKWKSFKQRRARWRLNTCTRTPSIVRKKRWKKVIITKPNNDFYLYYDRTLLLFSRPMRDKDTYAFREMFQYISLAEKPLDQWEITRHWKASSLWPSLRPHQT